MMRRLLALSSCLAVSLSLAGAAAAQNLVIRDARIIVRPGQTIERGSLVIEGGKIASASAGAPASVPRGARVIDGSRLTLMAGFIDNHRHLIRGRTPEEVARWMSGDGPVQMRELLEVGFTTVESGGDDNDGILELRRRIEAGEMLGPRIHASARVPTATMPSEEAVRAAVRAAKARGADTIAEVHYPTVAWPFAPTEQERKNLIAGLDEAKKIGIPFQVHAVSAEAMVDSTGFGAWKQVHSVNVNFMSKEQAQQIARTGAIVASITGFGSPVFNVFNQDNKPTFRDGGPWPDAILTHRGQGQEAGHMPVNLRTLYDAGVPVSYATDTTFAAKAAFAHELKTLNLVFSVQDLIQIMGPNSAKFLGKENEIGTLEPGKIADIVALGANPFEGYWNLLTAVMVVKGGEIVVDKRDTPSAYRPIVTGY